MVEGHIKEQRLAGDWTIVRREGCKEGLRGGGEEHKLVQPLSKWLRIKNTHPQLC